MFASGGDGKLALVPAGEGCVRRPNPARALLGLADEENIDGGVHVLEGRRRRREIPRGVAARPAGYVPAVPLFRRRRPDPPPWARFFSPDEWHHFAELVRYEAGRRRWEQDLDEGKVGHAESAHGLQNIAQICHASPHGKWPHVVAEHFVALDDIADVAFACAGEARAVLRARLISDDFVPPGGPDPARRRVADDLLVALAYDLPSRVVLPRRHDVLEWGEEEELFALALEQTRAERGGQMERHDFTEDQGGPATIWSFTGDSFFTATHALWSAHVEGPHGSIVAAPNRHAVLVHPIRDLDVVSAIPIMARVAQGLYTEGPGSLTPSLYWFRDGALTRLPVHVNDGAVTFIPPDEFVDALNELDEPGPGGEPPGPDGG
jgi:hypothetical protein